jgi:hypothetical protein
MDHVRLVFDRLAAAGAPSEREREAIYAACRADVAATVADGKQRERALEQLEKAIRRQEMRAIYEEAL